MLFSIPAFSQAVTVKKGMTWSVLPPPAAFNNNDFYNKWLGGIIATTGASAAPAKLADANAACATAFINDQPANCWQ